MAIPLDVLTVYDRSLNMRMAESMGNKLIVFALSRTGFQNLNIMNVLGVYWD